MGIDFCVVFICWIPGFFIIIEVNEYRGLIITATEPNNRIQNVALDMIEKIVSTFWNFLLNQISEKSKLILMSRLWYFNIYQWDLVICSWYSELFIFELDFTLHRRVVVLTCFPCCNPKMVTIMWVCFLDYIAVDFDKKCVFMLCIVIVPWFDVLWAFLHPFQLKG